MISPRAKVEDNILTVYLDWPGRVLFVSPRMTDVELRYAYEALKKNFGE